MMKTTDTTNTLGAAQTRRLTKEQTCDGCKQLEKLDAAVGWCPARAQYRSCSLYRECSDYRSSKTEG